jgi:hypothetical protein
MFSFGREREKGPQADATARSVGKAIKSGNDLTAFAGPLFHTFSGALFPDHFRLLNGDENS